LVEGEEEEVDDDTIERGVYMGFGKSDWIWIFYDSTRMRRLYWSTLAFGMSYEILVNCSCNGRGHSEFE